MPEYKDMLNELLGAMSLISKSGLDVSKIETLTDQTNKSDGYKNKQNAFYNGIRDLIKNETNIVLSADLQTYNFGG